MRACGAPLVSRGLRPAPRPNLNCPRLASKSGFMAELAYWEIVPLTSTCVREGTWPDLDLVPIKSPTGSEMGPLEEAISVDRHEQ